MCYSTSLSTGCGRELSGSECLGNSSRFWGSGKSVTSFKTSASVASIKSTYKSRFQGLFSEIVFCNTQQRIRINTINEMWLQMMNQPIVRRCHWWPQFLQVDLVVFQQDHPHEVHGDHGRERCKSRMASAMPKRYGNSESLMNP